MRTISKALAGGLGAAVAKIATQAVRHFAPDIDSAALEYALFTIITGLAVYVAPANAG
jgi:hypothetical protein